MRTIGTLLGRVAGILSLVFASVTAKIGGLVSLILLAVCYPDNKVAVTSLITAIAASCLLVIWQLASEILDSRPRVEVQCGENTFRRNAHTYSRVVIFGSPSAIVDTGDIFAFNVVNRGTKTIKNFNANLVSIAKDGRPLCTDIGGLPFEPRDASGDKLMVDLYHDMPQPAALCTIKDDGSVHFGSFGMTWRHAVFGDYFQEDGVYVLNVRISADNLESSVLSFMFIKNAIKYQCSISVIR